MDAVLLSRLQFALTIGFHYIFPPITIGMAWIIVYFQTVFLRTGNEFFKNIARFWIKLFAITFAMGVATGITMEFQFGTNWAEYSKFVGDIFGAPLAAEGIFAFFLESSFLGILLYGEKKVSKKVYWFSGLMVAVGSTLSAFWIIVANSWQQTPAGYEIINGRAELVNFWAAVFNPSTMPRYLHTITGAIIVGAFFMMGISSYFLLHKRCVDFAKKSLQVSLIFGFVFSLLILPLGHFHAVQVAKTQPIKLAAFEGLWETTDNAPFLLFGLPDPKNETTKFAISIPSALSIFVGGSADTEVVGLKSVSKENRPPILLTFFSFHTMVILGGYFMFLTGIGMYLLLRKKLFTNNLVLRLMLFSIPLPILANELGWIAAEVGRQPWIVQDLLKTKDAISYNVPAEQILFSIILFSFVYALIFVLWVFLLRLKIKKGPEQLV